MLGKGISRIGKPLQDINTSIQNSGNIEINKLEKLMPTLATVSGAAPMLGFLGTVTGMVTAFYNMSQAGANLTVSLLAGGIYEALVKKFGKENVYISSSNVMDAVKSPFPFKEKKDIMTKMFGIPSNKVVQVKNPYQPVEILSKLPKDTTYVTAVSQKDAERLEQGGKYFKNYDKVSDNKRKGYEDEGYYIVAPEMQLKVNGKNISGTQLRATFGDPTMSIADKKKIFNRF
jgi:hypothetical protein